MPQLWLDITSMMTTTSCVTLTRECQSLGRGGGSADIWISALCQPTGQWGEALLPKVMTSLQLKWVQHLIVGASGWQVSLMYEQWIHHLHVSLTHHPHYLQRQASGIVDWCELLAHQPCAAPILEATSLTWWYQRVGYHHIRHIPPPPRTPPKFSHQGEEWQHYTGHMLWAFLFLLLVPHASQVIDGWQDLAAEDPHLSCLTNLTRVVQSHQISAVKQGWLWLVFGWRAIGEFQAHYTA